MPTSIALAASLAGLVAFALALSSANRALTWACTTLLILGLFIVASYVILPTLAGSLSSGRLRSTSLSPLSARGIEWRSKAHAASILPTLRLERVRLAWGGLRNAETGLWVLRVDGVSLRVRKEHDHAPSKPRKASRTLTWALSRGLNLFIHHWPAAARILSVDVTDVRIIFDDLEGVELTVAKFCLGMRIEFEGQEPATAQLPAVQSPAWPLSPMSPLVDSHREFPFRCDTPRVAFDTDGACEPRPSRLRDARRRASVFQTRMSTTAAQVVSRAIARARGSITMSASVNDIALIMPRTSTATPDPPTAPATPFFNSFKRVKRRPSHLDEGYDRIASVHGQSACSFAFGFTPHKGLLGEDTLRTSLELGAVKADMAGVQRLQELQKRHVEHGERADIKSDWKADATPRVVLRAFESVSLSFAKLVVAHQLPAEGSGAYAIELQVTSLAARISAADSSNSVRARNAFGTNASPQSKIRGIAAALGWQSVELQCLAPGDAAHDQTQLLAIRQVEVDAFSSWRPAGWTREEMLFANDPNLALVVATVHIASIDLAADIQLLDGLAKATGQRESAPPSRSARPGQTPPRLRLAVELGHTSALLADSAQDTALVLATDGANVSCFSSYSDICGRRPVNAAKDALREEEALQTRRQSTDEVLDLALPEAMLKPQYRRTYDSPARLDDGMTTAMRADATVMVQPVALRMSLGQQSTYDVVATGTIFGEASGDVRGKIHVDGDGTEHVQLDSTTLSCSVNVGVDSGIKIRFWDKQIVDALVAMGQAHRPAPRAAPAKTPLLERLPSGVSAQLSLGQVALFIGSPDPNPDCHLKVVRGISLRTTAALNYAYYRHPSQGLRCRHALDQPTRKKLRLTDDVTSQALAFANALDKDSGHAALVSVSLMDTVMRILEDNAEFEGAYSGQNHDPIKSSQPQTPRDDADFVAWDFLRKKTPEDGTFVNNVPPLDMACRPLVRVSHVLVNFLAQQPTADADVEYKLTSRCELVSLAADEAAVWCALLGAQAVRHVLDAWKRPTSAAPAGAPARLSLNVSVPTVWIHLSLPLKEQVFLSLGTIQVSKAPGEGARATSDYVLLHVPSPKHVGSWEELARIRAFALSTSSAPLAFHVKATSMRVRIPHAYTLSKLVLNVNMLVKTLKLLAGNLKSGHFEYIKNPVAEAPKRIPRIGIEISNLNLEAKDHPMETNMNLAWRVGLIEQETRNRLEDTFEQKLHILAETHGDMVPDDASRGLPDLHESPKLSDKFGVSLEEARYRLDWYMSRAWVRRMKRAKLEQRRREVTALRPLQISAEIRLPISVVPPRNTAPLFRAAFRGIRLGFADPGLDRKDIIQYMSDVSAPFKDDVEFSLMVPLDFEWEMAQATVQLRDYPLPLIRVQPVADGSRPAWSVSTLLVIAEELAGPESCVVVPCEVLPAGRGQPTAKALVVQVAKTVMPVKTYARPVIQIASEKTTEFTWGNSYQPAIQDLMRVVESLSHPPRDPSPKIGFWDKFRLILHWRVTIDFVGPVHLHLKGSYDPYSFTGHGAGFALSWRGGTRLEIAQPNEQYETIQIKADELLIAIPDLTALKDGAAVGVDPNPASPNTARYDERDIIERRSTKPCARFLNGVRVGFGFRFERTCRPWSCRKCGGSENVMHRQCRIFDFKQHQEVILRSPEALHELEEAVGHPVDSYEGFRSDFIHFSVSCIAAPKQEERDDASTGAGLDAESHNSLHFSPKAFAHFYAWWSLFDHTMSLPIRQGKAFPESGPPSKKFGRSLGTIKYRFNLAPVYVSHFYSQVSQDLWSQGKAQYVGLKVRFGHFRADAHQRAQEKVVRHEKLKRTTTVVHKPFYAADLLLDQLRVKGIAADFCETRKSTEHKEADADIPHVGNLPPELRQWYNFFDFIDADRKPFDRNPRVSIVDIGDCPHVFFAKRVKARQTTANDDDQGSVASSTSHIDVESSKFGHELSHICYLNTMKGVGEMQREITEGRMRELQQLLDEMMAAKTDDGLAQRKVIEHRLHILRRHLDYLASSELRRIDGDTFQAHDAVQAAQATNRQGDMTFENTFHVHCPRIFFNDISRNIVFKYWFSSQDRKREEYTTSHASLRGVRDGINRRFRRMSTGLNQDDIRPDGRDTVARILSELEHVVVDKSASSSFHLPRVSDDDLRQPSIGLPLDCIVKPKNHILVLKPQIALRSEVDVGAIVLLAVEEISFKGFAILDEKGFDQVTANVMARNYVKLQGLQAFSPTDETMQRTTGPRGVPRGLDFVPLEIFLDVRSEATDYDRIVLKTDAVVSFDKFNHLRMPRGLEWPESRDDSGRAINHLRIHQDLTSIVIPRLTVSATSKHYASLYNVVTNLLVYQDPAHVARSKQIDAFMFTFDRKDRNPQKLLTELFTLQQNIRLLSSLQQGYESNLDLLSETGKNELFKIRTDLLQATEQLFVVFEAISVTQAKDEARAALKSVTRLDAKVGGVAWHVLQDDFKPLAKFDVERAAISHVNNKDGSSDCGIVLGDLSALNSNADALFPEMVSRYFESRAKKDQRDPFITAAFSLMPPVGGISIFRDLRFRIHPVRLKIEKEVGEKILDYFVGETKKIEKRAPQPQPARPDMPPLSRSRSQVSIASMAANGRGRANTALSDNRFGLVPGEDVSEMRKRASNSRTYLNIHVAASAILLTWRGEGWFPDCTDLKIRTPALSYSNQTWSSSEIVDAIKKDVVRAGWKQLPDFLGQFWSHATWLRTKQSKRERELTMRADAHMSSLKRRDVRQQAPAPARSRSVDHPAPTEVSYTVQPPTPLEPEDGVGSIARGTASPRVNGGGDGARVLGLGISHSPAPSTHDRDDDKGVGKAVKGLLTKLRPGHGSRHDLNGSTDELARTTTSDTGPHSPLSASTSSMRSAQ